MKKILKDIIRLYMKAVYAKLGPENIQQKIQSTFKKYHLE